MYTGGFVLLLIFSFLWLIFCVELSNPQRPITPLTFARFTFSPLLCRDVVSTHSLKDLDHYPACIELDSIWAFPEGSSLSVPSTRLGSIWSKCRMIRPFVSHSLLCCSDLGAPLSVFLSTLRSLKKNSINYFLFFFSYQGLDTHKYFKQVTGATKAVPLWDGLNVGAVTFQIKRILNINSDSASLLFQTVHGFLPS